MLFVLIFFVIPYMSIATSNSINVFINAPALG